MASITQAEFARRHGVSRAAVAKWKRRHMLVMDGDRVDAEASDANLKKYRRSRTPAIDRADRRAERIGNAAAPHSLPEALRIKENYLALLHKLEYEQKSAAVVAVANVPRVRNEKLGRVRERLLRIPREAAREVHQAASVVIVQDILTQTIRRALEDLTGCRSD